MGSSTAAPNDRCVRDVLSEEGGKVRAIVVKFGRERGKSAIWASLLFVRKADRQGCPGWVFQVLGLTSSDWMQ